ncbi:hypothetical protein L0222_18035 [bacterium]|nr:hypothetical protein [bacterium]MCI0604184.1 hypothetical protein [bacterium]
MTETAQKAEAPAVSTNLWYISVLVLLGWMIPGAAHLLLKRPKRAITFFLCIVILFYWGLNLGARIWHYEPQQPLTFFAMVSQTGVGTPYFTARTIASYARNHSSFSLYSFANRFRFGEGNIESVTFEYGNTFTWVAGLLNFLVILDAYDIAHKRKE